MLDLLAEGHVIKEHSYRHGVEKIQRKQLLKEVFEAYDLGKLTIDEFFTVYSNFCEFWVEETTYCKKSDMDDS